MAYASVLEAPEALAAAGAESSALTFRRKGRHRAVAMEHFPTVLLTRR